jgi:hypothetical protein
MIPLPVVLDLTPCDYVIVEEGTKKVSVIGSIGKLTATQFPFTPPPFWVHMAFTDAVGDATIDLVIMRLDTLEEVYSRQRQITFSDRLDVFHLMFRIRDFSFETPGVYQVGLYVDREWAAQRRLRVALEET